MTEPVRKRVDANGVSLNVYVMGAQSASQATPVVLLHGMRDVGLSLMPVAARLAEVRPVYLMDLRGHGGSDQPGNYAMVQFVFDLHCVISQLIGAPTALLGHSLGGHIVSRFAALYPDLAAAAILVEGLGPPAGRFEGDPAVGARIEGRRILETLSIPVSQRPLPDIAFAASRLKANNPRLDSDHALELAHQGTVRNADGELNWAFDPRVGSVFLSLDAGGSEAYWSRISCPVCVIGGAHSAEYWSRAAPSGSDWDGAFAAGELESRVATFPDAEFSLMQGSGHMVHFDEPDNLAEISMEFLRRRL